MNHDQIEDLLSAKSRRLPSAGEDQGWRERHREAIVALTPLLEVARDVAALLVPVHISLTYRAELHQSLVAAARQQQAQRSLRSLLLPPGLSHPVPGASPYLWDRVNEWAGSPDWSSVDRRWVVGAAVVGSALSLAGILHLVLRQRSQPAA